MAQAAARVSFELRHCWLFALVVFALANCARSQQRKAGLCVAAFNDLLVQIMKLLLATREVEIPEGGMFESLRVSTGISHDCTPLQ